MSGNDPKQFEACSRRTAIKTLGAAGASLAGVGATGTADAATYQPIWTDNWSDHTTWSQGDSGSCEASYGVMSNFGVAQIEMGEASVACGTGDQWEHRFVSYGITTTAHESGSPTAMIDGQSIDATAQSDICGSDGPTLQVLDSYAVEIGTMDAEDWLDTHHYGENDNADEYDQVRDYANQWENDISYIDKENDFNSWNAATSGIGLMMGAAGMVSSSVFFPYIGLSMSAVSFLDAMGLFGTRHVEEKTDTSYSISRGTGFSGEKAIALHYVDFVVDVPKGEELQVDVDHEFNYRDDPCTGDIDDKIRDGFCYTLHIRDNPETSRPYAEQCGRL